MALPVGTGYGPTYALPVGTVAAVPVVAAVVPCAVSKHQRYETKQKQRVDMPVVIVESLEADVARAAAGQKRGFVHSARALRAAAVSLSVPYTKRPANDVRLALVAKMKRARTE